MNDIIYMDIRSDAVLGLTDYVLLNSYTLTSSGLYEGKAGHALCLFEISCFFQDEELHVSAFELLQEALLSKTENIDFAFGLSGIGYTLAYLIRHDFIEAEFHDFFGKQQAFIFSKIKDDKNKWKFLNLIPFLLEYKQLIPADKNSGSLITGIVNDSMNRAECAFSIKNWHKETQKESWMSYLKILLRTLYLLQTEKSPLLYDMTLLSRLICNLSILLKAGRISLTNETAFYMKQIDGLKGIAYPDKLTIHTDSSRMLDFASLTRLSAIEIFSNYSIFFDKNPFKDWTNDTIEQKLNAHIGKQQKLCSWKQGIIRYLLYWIYRENPEKRLFSLLLH